MSEYPDAFCIFTTCFEAAMIHYRTGVPWIINDYSGKLLSRMNVVIIIDYFCKNTIHIIQLKPIKIDYNGL